jgi:hypothetical protein
MNVAPGIVPVPAGMGIIPCGGWGSSLFILRVGVRGPVPGSGAAFAIASLALLASKTRYVYLRNSAPLQNINIVTM